MSSRRVRSRVLPFRIGGSGYAQQWRDNSPPFTEGEGSASDPGIELHGSQITDSEGHPFKHRTGANKGDIGGDFYTVKQYVIDAKSTVRLNESYSQNGFTYHTQYEGTPLPIAFNDSHFPPIVPFADHVDSLDELGATAVNIVKPTNSVADLAVSLGELRTEGLPKLPGIHSWQSRARAAKKAGSEYLGVQFGWLPFVGEIKNVSHGVTESERILSQYIRDSGKLVRRRIEFPVTESFESEVLAHNVPDYGQITSHLLAQMPSGDVIRDIKTTTKEVFSGGFTYHLPGDMPGFDGIRDQSLYAKKILGLDLSPDTVWNLTPWSWAIDWFSNTGSVVSNLSDYALDGLVMRYGYVQRHVVVSHSYRHTSLPSVPPIIFVTETKMRQRANPFGFGLQWNGLSPRQLAIAAALGIKRVL